MIYKIGSVCCLCLIFFLSGCDSKAKESKQLVRDSLKDGDPKFRNTSGECGEVSSKNSSGAYSDFKRYIAVSGVGVQLEPDRPSATFENIWYERCDGEYSRVSKFATNDIDQMAFDQCAEVVITYASDPDKFEYYPRESTNFSNDKGHQVVTLSFSFSNTSYEKIYHKAECIISPDGNTTMTQMM